MMDLDRLAEISFVIFVLDQIVVFEGGIVVDKNNFSEFMSFQFDA